MSPRSDCPNPLELTRMFTDGSGATPWSHVHSCPECGARFQEFLRLRELARALPTVTPTAEQREQVRTELLSRAAGALRASDNRRRVQWRIASAVGLSLAALLVLIALRMRASGEHVYRAVARGDATARFVRAGAQPDEIVRLTEGTVSLEVAPLHRGERFRVVVGDGEVEVRGTAFDVVAHADHLVAVRVRHGRVEVRPHSGPVTVLGIGQAWKAPASEPSATRTPAIAAPATSSAAAAAPDTFVAPDAQRELPPTAALAIAHPLAKHTHVAAARMTQAEAAFERAWASLRAGRALQAGQQLDDVLAAHPDPGLEEAAAYWRAVALARAGRADKAAPALAAFLARHAASPRAGEASAMLGWMLLKSGNAAGATQRFEAALNDAVPEVRASARAGLEAAEAQRARSRAQLAPR